MSVVDKTEIATVDVVVPVTVSKEVPSRLLGSWSSSWISLFLSFVAMWPAIFTNKVPYGTFGWEFSKLFFMAVPAAIVGVVLAYGYNRAHWDVVGRGRVQSAIVLSIVAMVAALCVGVHLFTELP